MCTGVEKTLIPQEFLYLYSEDKVSQAKWSLDKRLTFTEKISLWTRWNIKGMYKLFLEYSIISSKSQQKKLLCK